jgi:hypothetical protein
LREILTSFQEASLGAVNARLDSIRAEFHRVADGGGEADDDNNMPFDEGDELIQGTQGQPSCTFAYNGHFYDVPQDFSFPKATLREGLRFWLQGQTVSTDGSKVVKPLCQLKLAGLPNGATKTQFKVHWTPIFLYLEANIAFALPTDWNRRRATDADINWIYELCLSFLKENVSYCFVQNGYLAHGH